jgi:hypothetical protein
MITSHDFPAPSGNNLNDGGDEQCRDDGYGERLALGAWQPPSSVE